MSRNANRTPIARPRRKSRKSFLFIVVAALVVIVLLWQEQIALLYVLATLSVAALLAVVSFADLRGARQSAAVPAPFDDSAAIGDGIASTTGAPSTTFGSKSPRTVKRTRKR
jgi:peptidoglycan/LPS O-acetylase OafA/YrhL